MLNLENIRVHGIAGIDMSDAPRFCDAYITSASIQGKTSSRALSQLELDSLNENTDFVLAAVENFLQLFPCA